MSANATSSTDGTDGSLAGQLAFFSSFAFLLVVTVIGSLVGEIAFGVLHRSGLSYKLPAIVVVALPPFISGAVFPFLLIRLLYRADLKQFGVRWIDRNRSVAPWMIGSSLIVLCGWLALWGILCGALSVVPRELLRQHHVEFASFYSRNPLYRIVHGSHDSESLALVVHMSLLVGFAEELFGRGFLQNVLDRRYKGIFGRGRFSIRTSTVLAAVLFALWHVNYLNVRTLELLPANEIFKSAVVAMTVVFVPSLMICVVYEKTRSLAAVVVVHDVVDGGKLFTWLVWSLLLPA
jgi:membrane protease YdiL (CAAX protease family)